MARKKKDDTAPAEETTFEQDLERLEAIVGELEDGDLPLERALALFEEGTSLGRRCGRRLDEVERKITVLMEKSDGSLEARDHEPEAEAPPPAAPVRSRKGAAGRLFDDGDEADPDGVPF
jgi:exodeoxyribonuclease VII small subunit